jgi:flavin reductase (DIM6/NTAB) family NADH-FMN oxidoreductase RutF
MVGLKTLPALGVKAPLVAGVPAALEVRATQFIPVQDTPSVIVLGQVLHFHLREGLLLANGAADSFALGLIGRFGGGDYLKQGQVFNLERPTV